MGGSPKDIHRLVDNGRYSNMCKSLLILINSHISCLKLRRISSKWLFGKSWTWFVVRSFSGFPQLFRRETVLFLLGKRIKSFPRAQRSGRPWLDLMCRREGLGEVVGPQLAARSLGLDGSRLSIYVAQRSHKNMKLCWFEHLFISFWCESKLKTTEPQFWMIFGNHFWANNLGPTPIRRISFDSNWSGPANINGGVQPQLTRGSSGDCGPIDNPWVSWWEKTRSPVHIFSLNHPNDTS